MYSEHIHLELHSQHTSCCLVVGPNPTGFCYFVPDWPCFKVVCACQTGTWVPQNVPQCIKAIFIPQSEQQKNPQQVENIISSDWLGGSAFPLTSTASWSLLFCTQTQQSRNNIERKWKNVTLYLNGWNTLVCIGLVVCLIWTRRFRVRIFFEALKCSINTVYMYTYIPKNIHEYCINTMPFSMFWVS